MPVTRRESKVTRNDAGIRLDTFLAEWLSTALEAAVPRSAIRRLIMAGAVALNGRPVRRPGLVLEEGWRVQARVDLARLSAAVKPTAQPAGPGDLASAAPVGIEVLYRDPWLIAVAKPAGLLVHASADALRPDLFTRLRLMLDGEPRAEGAVTPVPYLGLHHRLDVDTSGVMLFTLDPTANAPLSRAFAEHRVEKVYHALVPRPAAPFPDRWIDGAPLAMVGTGRRARMSVVSSGGVAAETAFAVARRLRSTLVIEARPRTGRKHQIRAHLAARGLPILGDVRYGGPLASVGIPIPRVMLHACALRLPHPVTGSPLDIRCPYPQDFRDLLARLKAPSV